MNNKLHGRHQMGPRNRTRLFVIKTITCITMLMFMLGAASFDGDKILVPTLMMLVSLIWFVLLIVSNRR